MYLHSGCIQKQTYGREGEQLVPSNSPSCATINHCYGISPLKGRPKVTGSLCAAVRLPLGWTVRQHLQKSGKEQ